MTDEELTSLMGLLRGADSTELKLTVPPASHRDTIQGLPIDPVETQPRQVYFFDTPDLALNRAGLVVRARRIQGGKGDTVIKLRPVDPADLSPEHARRRELQRRGGRPAGRVRLLGFVQGQVGWRPDLGCRARRTTTSQALLEAAARVLPAARP